MNESTARAERFEPHSPALPFFVWDAPQKPVSVRISLDAIERLEREVVASFRSVSARGSEIGGLLLGRVTAGPRPVVSVEAYEPVACDYSRGPLYRLSEKDLEGLDAACRRRAAGENGLVVVGAFRGHTRKDLALDHYDVTLFTERFRETEKIFLLVKPFATKPAKAALFTWEDGKIREASQVEFPFTRAELVSANLVRALPVNGAAAAASASVPEAAPQPEAKPAARAQVVPIASRRETSAPVTAPEPEHPEPEPAAQAPQAAQPEPQRTEAPAFASLGEGEPQSGRRIGKLVWIAGGLAVAALLMTLLIYPGLLVRRGPAPAATNIDSSTLALRVERSAGQLLLTWSRESEAVKTATKAVLSISDGPQQENVQLDLAQLRNGSVVYSPVTSDVSFRLEVTSANQEKSISEHVRVLGTRPSPMAPAGEESAKKENKKEEAETAAKDGAAEEAEAAEPAEPAKPRESLSARWRQPESLGQRLRPATPSDLAAPPTLTRTGGIGGGPGLPGALPGSPAPPAPAPPVAAARPASPSGVRIGGQVQEAQVVARKDPVYPQLARQARVQGVVEVEATVGKDGTVRNVKVLSGHPLLRPAAVDAVKQWRYRPTLLNGEAVEVTTRVAVGFTLNN